MTFPQGGRRVIEELCAAHTNLQFGSEEDRRTLTKMIAETFCAEFGDHWGTKSQTRTHPQSKDAIAYRLDNSNLDIWDWQNGSTRAIVVNDGSQADYQNVAHFFIAVQPINHLKPTTVPITKPGPEAKIDRIIELLEKIVEQGS